MGEAIRSKCDTRCRCRVRVVFLWTKMPQSVRVELRADSVSVRDQLVGQNPTCGKKTILVFLSHSLPLGFETVDSTETCPV